MKAELGVIFWTKFFLQYVVYKGLLGEVNYFHMEGMLIRDE